MQARRCCSLVSFKGPSPLLARSYVIKVDFAPPQPDPPPKPVPPHLIQDNDALLDVFDVPLEYTYQDTPHWRETPAIARRRAEKKRLGEIRRRAKVYWDDLQKQEAQRARDEQAQIDKAKAENMERKRALWREKRKFIVAAEAEDRASRAKAWKQTETFLKEKEKQKHEGRLEFLRCLKEEEDKLDVLDLPYLARLRNLKYDTWGGREWYKAPQPPKMKK